MATFLSPAPPTPSTSQKSTWISISFFVTKILEHILRQYVVVFSTSHSTLWVAFIFSHQKFSCVAIQSKVRFRQSNWEASDAKSFFTEIRSAWGTRPAKCGGGGEPPPTQPPAIGDVDPVSALKLETMAALIERYQALKEELECKTCSS
jgi:hypothetical protein